MRIAKSTPYLIHNDDCHVTRLLYRMVLACLRDIVNFWSRTIWNYNEVNAELKAREKIIVFLKIGQVTRIEYSRVNSIISTEGVDFL